MTLNQLANRNLIWVAGGTIAGMVGAGFVEGKLNNQYSREIAGGILFAGGSLMIAKGSTEVKKLGTGLGSAGLSLAGTSIYNRVAGQTGMSNLSEGDTITV